MGYTIASGEMEGPYHSPMATPGPLLTQGLGYVCVFPQGATTLIWVPSRDV